MCTENCEDFTNAIEDWKSFLQSARTLSHRRRRQLIKRAKRGEKRRAFAKLTDSQHSDNSDVPEESDEDDACVLSGCGDYFCVGLCLEHIRQNFKPANDKPPEVSAALAALAPSNGQCVATQAESHSDNENNNLTVAPKSLPGTCGSGSTVVENERKTSDNLSEKEVEITSLLNTLDAELKDWHNPYIDIPSSEAVPATPPCRISPERVEERDICKDKPRCPFYDAVGCCRYGDKCSRRHKHYKCTTTLLMPGMFKTFAFDMTRRAKKSGGVKGDDYGISLEYTDEDLYGDFEEFSKDVLLELDKFGRVVQFKVCCNRTDHLQGNVYVEYEKKRHAKRAFEKLHQRFYDGKRVQCRYIKIKSWKRAICGMHYRRGHCTHGDRCSFLHVFKDKSGKFRKADNDYYR